MASIEHSDEENEIISMNTTKSRRKAKILDSDSENEDVVDSKQDSSNEENMTEHVEKIDNNKKERGRILAVNSDSEEENNTSAELDGNTGIIRNELSSSRKDIENINNESDIHESVEEEEISPHNKSFPDEETAVETVIYVTNSKGELVQENVGGNIKKSSLSALCDSESSEDEDARDVVERTYIDEPVIKPIVYKSSRKKKTEDKPKLMTAKEAAKQKIEIQSDSQRRLRESTTSLPYHKPKSYTIKEFLEKRSKLASALPALPKAPPSVAIKMTKDQLLEVSKKLDERIKEVEEFYKSESDEDEDEENDDPSEEIKDWLFTLVDNAVDSVEKKLNDMTVVEDIQNDDDCPKNESMEYEFNLDDVNESEITKKPKISELLKDKLSIQPKLSGTPDDIIDLEEGVTKPSRVKKLVEKFFRHAVQKVPHKHKVELDVVGVGAHGEIIKETVSMNVDEDDEPVVEAPGAKLQKLREELQLQMAQKRLELWKQKHEQGDCLVTEKKNYNDEYEKDILDDEDEEFEMTESESEDTDEEEDETKIEKPETKSAFIEDEACEDEEMEEDEDDGGDADNENDDGDEVPEKIEFESPKKKTMKRILKPFSEDSDEESTQDSEPTKILKYYTNDEDDFIPPNLPRVGKTPQRTQVDKNKSEFDFLTPVTYLTGLQNLNSDSKYSKDSPNSPQTLLDSPLSENTSSQSSIQKNLFPENCQSSQSNMEDLAQLCSGTFPETQIQSLEEKVAEEIPPSTQELLSMCSGDFGSLKETDELDKVTEELPPTTQDLLNMCSGDFSTLTTTIANSKSIEHQDKVMINVQTNAEKEIKSLDEENDQIISQLLDEDELERFKKKFESPVNPPRKNIVLEDVEEVNATGLIDSDDENEKLEIKTKKKQKKLVFSDDEGEENIEPSNEELEDSDDEESVNNEENIDLHDSDDEEQQLENEIIQQESVNYKPSDFLDKEAELSESEWGSADEDEKDLDELEFEQGDDDKINEKKVRMELERMHVQNLLDEDNREVKLLQEMLLEDGELHGTGRKRQFRWKTLDSVDNGEFEKRDDDDIFLDEEENEAEFRKMRHKREMFLKKKSTTEDDDDSILGDSQILKIGQQIFKNKSFNSQNSTPINKTEETKEPFTLLSKRGSFLSRNDQVLQRLAEYNKVTNTIGTTVTKKSKSFVFQTVDINESADVKDNNNKRKATEGTPNVIKKLRLNDLSPAPNKQTKSSRAKKLFGNW